MKTLTRMTLKQHLKKYTNDYIAGKKISDFLNSYIDSEDIEEGKMKE